MQFRYWKHQAYMIDVSQSVEHDHPRALEFLRKDCTNVTDFFEKKGVGVMTVRELFDFVTDVTLAKDTVDDYLDKVRASGGWTSVSFSFSVSLGSFLYVCLCLCLFVSVFLSLPDFFEKKGVGVMTVRELCVTLTKDTVDDYISRQDACIGGMDSRVFLSLVSLCLCLSLSLAVPPYSLSLSLSLPLLLSH